MRRKCHQAENNKEELQVKHTGLWRGLSALMCFLLALSIIAGQALEANSATIDTYLGTQSERIESDGALYDKFKPSKEVLNADGTGNSHALIQKAIDLNREQAYEGAVLLKNENQALPLASGSSVTLFGIRSHKPVLGSAFGVKVWGPVITLEQALRDNRTSFASTIADSASTNWQTGEVTIGLTMNAWTGDEFDFDGAGYKVNPTMIEIYEKLLEKYHHEYNEGAEELFDPREPSLSDIAAVNAGYKGSFAQYKDAAIVVISRASGESHDYLPGGVAEGLGMDEPLALSQNERDAIALAKEASDRVIVLINSSASVEIAELKNDPDVDAILWIGAPGAYGMLGIADILCGKVNPSGGLFDIFTAKNMSAPAMQNMGNFRYANAADKVSRGGGTFGGNTGMYIMEAEGIYVGYRYYETRYYDSVIGAGNASSKAGAYASSGDWNYDEEVTYGFGFGLSYTTFGFAFDGEPVYEVVKNSNGSIDATATFKVKVTNTGKTAGKTSVQIYGKAPYERGGLEKSAIQLLNYEKSGIIQPGASETVTVKVDLQYIASYDSSLNNGEGGYVLDPGKYYFAVGNGAHEALKNIMVKEGLKVDGNADYAVEKDIDESFIARTAFSISKTGEKITNRIPYADWNYFQKGEVTYLSRADWAGTWPKSYTGMTLTNQQLIDLLNGKYYTISTTDDTSSVIWNEGNGARFYEMWGVDYDDEKWDELIRNMTLEEAQYLATYGGPSIPGAETIGTVETYMTENAGNGVAVSLNASKDTTAPWTIAQNDKNGNWHPEVFGNSPLMASSFNPELCYRIGAFIGEESLFVGIPILWGPGLNTHRHAYNGRNGEYYSEDPVLSGVTAMEFAIGALQYGLIAAPKHYAFNDQETNRSGVAPYMTEQRAREVELRAYQYAFEATKYDTPEFDQGMRGLMISFSKIGPVECTASVGLMTDILAKEWGFRGYAVTDIYDDFDIYGAVLTSGTTCFDTRGMSGFYTNTTLDGGRFANQVDGSTVNAELFKGDLKAQEAIKAAVHKVLFAMSQSNLMNRYDATTHVVKLPVFWRTAYQAAEIGFGVLFALFTVLAVISRLKNKEAK
ncbi:MAG: glycoside hydrolase family 3 C-terminal domain-containing protein [Lachnospiraceae bacterium]|nr:glycoside hydrolase family 3 C-terminal domain-containing protein [Lachnospiraceae bacterium]